MVKSSTSYLFHVICTTSFSMSSASPFSKGSAIMVILFLSITSHSCQSLTLGGGDTSWRKDWLIQTPYHLKVDSLQIYLHSNIQSIQSNHHSKGSCQLSPDCTYVIVCVNKNITLNTHFLFGVSAKHLRDDVSTTVSQKVTTGSATCAWRKTTLQNVYSILYII